MLVHQRTVGDTLSKLAATLKADGVEVDLSGRDVKFLMVDADGNVVIAETEVGVTVDADQVTNPGDVEYDFTDAGVEEGGDYYAYFRVYGLGGESTEFDTYPPEGIKVIIHDTAEDRTTDETIDVVAAANNPKRMRTEEGSIEERSVNELIAADRYNAAKSSASAVPWGLRIARTQPAGINGRN